MHDDDCGNDHTAVLSKEAERELGGDKIVFVVAFDAEGNQTVFRPGRVKTGKVSFPLDVKSINRVEPISLIGVTQNPTCYCWVSGGQARMFCI